MRNVKTIVVAKTSAPQATCATVMPIIGFNGCGSLGEASRVIYAAMPSVSCNILRDLHGEARLPFKYFDKGTMATIGRKRAVAQIGRWHLSGYFAWLMWLFVHLVLLVGFRNRLMVMREWIWAFFTRERSARLITGDTDAPSFIFRSVAVADLTGLLCRVVGYSAICRN